jgi:hypothetical protein
MQHYGSNLFHRPRTIFLGQAPSRILFRIEFAIQRQMRSVACWPDPHSSFIRAIARGAQIGFSDLTRFGGDAMS